jgi:O-antigen/teichoic acid export membrane protein
MAIDKNDFRQPESLSKRVVQGGIWVFGLRIANRSLGFIRTIILARLLAPHDFGLFGIALLAIATLETFSQTGFQAALVQKKKNVEPYLDTAWTISAIRGIILFLILFSSAPLIANFFDSAQATLIIKVIAVSTLLSGFRNIGIIFFQKELEFNKQFLYEISATLVDLTVAIILAFILRNVWALVWGGLAANFVRVFMSYIIHPYRPRIKFEKEKFQELFAFGKWVLGSSILVFLITQGDDIFVGKMLGVTALGLYQMAYLISNLPATEITHVISQVTFPAYSKLQDDLPKLREAYLKVFQVTAFISIPLAGAIFVFARDFTQFVLGDKWLPIIPIIQVLSFWGAIRSIGSTAGPAFQGIGNVKIIFKLQFVILFILVASIYPLATKFGILGVAVSVCMATIIPNAIAIAYLARKIHIEARRLIVLILIPLITTVLVVISIQYLNAFVLPVTGVIHLIIFVFYAIIAYAIIIYLSDKSFDYGIFNTIKYMMGRTWYGR